MHFSGCCMFNTNSWTKGSKIGSCSVCTCSTKKKRFTQVFKKQLYSSEWTFWTAKNTYFWPNCASTRLSKIKIRSFYKTSSIETGPFPCIILPAKLVYLQRQLQYCCFATNIAIWPTKLVEYWNLTNKVGRGIATLLQKLMFQNFIANLLRSSKPFVSSGALDILRWDVDIDIMFQGVVISYDLKISQKKTLYDPLNWVPTLRTETS